jgi:hypothetical protein
MADGRWRWLTRLAALALLWTSTGCRAFGYTDRVVWRIPSPDDRLVAVCQEVPVFDGPDYTIRLERRDGSLVRGLYGIGDGDPCSEMTWSADGRTLAILSGHVARIRLVDVAWALAHLETATAHWSWRVVDLGSSVNPLRADHLRFVDARTIEVRLCDDARGSNLPNGRQDCSASGRLKRFEIPLPIVTGHR